MAINNHTGTWRSYKTFLFRGEVKHHDAACYQELTITPDGELVLRLCAAANQKQVLKKDAWQVRTEGKRCFLYLEGKKAYEIITLEEKELVLQEPVSGEKIFFAAIPVWQQRLQPPKEEEQHIYLTLWSKSLFEIITVEK